MRITFEPLDLGRHLSLVHAWVTHPRSAFWGLLGASSAEVEDAYARIAADPHHEAFLGRLDGEPVVLAERYDPAHSPLAGLPELRPGDVGMHLLVAPPAGPPVAGLTAAAFDAVVRLCLADPATRRVVVEPDVRNEAVRAKNRAAGFIELRPVRLEDKTAMLSVCAREDVVATAPGAALAHLAPEPFAHAQRRLVAKAIAEFAHERLLTPVPEAGADRYRLDGPGSSYVFTARRHPLEHWVVDPDSIERTAAGTPAEPDAQAFVAEFAPALGIPEDLLPTYLEEIAATLASSAWKLRHGRDRVDDLLDGDFQDVESGMTEGHPAFVANNGRIGFGVDDHAAFAPETGRPTRLVWVAARRAHTRLSLGAGVEEAALYDGELGPAVLDRFRRTLRGVGVDPDDYLFLPLHPWQWRTRMAVTFAPDLARRDLVLLGEGDDRHLPQQSVRTFFNASRPQRHYVKTALAIQNMGFLRGLSPAYMEATPAINDWVADLVAGDPELASCGFGVLREVAAIGYTGDAFHRLAGPSPYRKMVAALWRESPLPRLAEGERLATMASLLHRDGEGRALATAMIEASPLDASTWVTTYLRAYLRPLVHCLCAYDLAFMPHGENLVMVVRDHVPVRMIMKDIGEEVAVMGDLPLPPEVERIRAQVPEDVKALAVHTDVMDGFLRFLAAILAEDGVLPTEEFWAIARDVVLDHAADHPELAEAVGCYDLLRPEFRHSCLNRLQLRNTRQMVDLTDQASSLMFAGTLRNPLAVPSPDRG